jgi:carboxypeptidase C (cathepsin A)
MMNKITILMIVLALHGVSSFAAKHPSPDRVIDLPGFGKVTDLQYAGCLPISPKEIHHSTANLFYWYVQNQKKDPHAPLVLWLNGGPGAASMYGFFMENGPYIVQNNLTLTKRHYTWTQAADYLIIDQPAGVGLSYEEKKTYTNEAQAMDQLYQSLQHFFTRHPQLKSKSIYLAGESYGGKYLPQLALRIIEGNKDQPVIHLKGLLLGDAWVNPKVQQEANVDFAYYHGLVDQHDRLHILKLYTNCAKEIGKQSPSSRLANQVCSKIQDFIQKKSGHLNLANIAKGIEPDDQYMIRYLNNPKVRKALHVDTKVKNFQNFSTVVADRLEIGEQDSVADLYPQILASGIRVLLYNGLEDGKDSNFLSTNLWLSKLNWPYKNEFNQANSCVWLLGKNVAGYAKSVKGLTQVRILNAGHLAPIDQPPALFDLFNHFIQNKPLC